MSAGLRHGPGCKGSAYNFLLVEDDPDQVLMFRRALRRVQSPATCHVADNGEEAISYLSGRGVYRDRAKYPLPCLVILDLHLPRKGGLEVLEWLKGHPGLRHIPAVMLTTSSDPSDVKRAAELGASAYWTKPLRLESLERIARRISVFLRMFCSQVLGQTRPEDGGDSTQAC